MGTSESGKPAREWRFRGAGAMPGVGEDRGDWVVATTQLGSGWAVDISMGKQRGRLVITDVRVRPELASAWAFEPPQVDELPDAGVQAANLAHVRWGAMFSEAKAAAHEWAEIAVDFYAEHGESPTFTGAVESWADHARRALPGWTSPPRKPGHRPDPTVYAATAVRYAALVESGCPKPVHVIAEFDGVPPAVVRERIRTARAPRHGYLTDAPADGKAGGTATDKAKSDLRDAGVMI